MTGRPPGRPKEHGEGDWLTVQEAADRLGITYQAVHKRIQRGTIEYDEWIDAEGGRPHLRIPLSALQENVEPKELDQRNAERAMRVEEVLMSEFAERAKAVEALRREIGLLRAEMSSALANQERMISNQERMEGLVTDATGTLKEQADTEKAFQEENLELQQENLKVMRQMGERRGFFERFFPKRVD